MANVLFLAHRLPYPPNKGDKIHTYQLLKHLAARHRVFLGTFVDDPDDEQYLPVVRAMCAELHVSRLNPRWARLRSLRGLITGEPLTVSFYEDSQLRKWVRQTRAQHRLDATLVFSSSMIQFAEFDDKPVVVDFADVDSAKWAEYSERHAWPMSWVYRREARTLLRVERQGAAQARRSLFTTEKEVELFASLVPESAERCAVRGSGVDSEYFSVDLDRSSPYNPDEIPLVFMGAMDYWPNVDAVTWFASEALPRLRQRWPQLRFHIVGRSPTPAVRALAGDAVSVTGTVPDVRPYVQHAAAVVAPMRLARGIQNKVLEAMAMARPVVVASRCVAAMEVQAGVHLIAAESVDDYVFAVAEVLTAPERARAMGLAGRQQVLSAYSWPARLAGLDGFLGLNALNEKQ